MAQLVERAFQRLGEPQRGVALVLHQFERNSLPARGPMPGSCFSASMSALKETARSCCCAHCTEDVGRVAPWDDARFAC